jgi:hypothetical protein
MTADGCSREDHIVQAVLSGAWPHGCDGELVTHAAQCGICAEVAGIVTLLRADHDEARRHVHVPAAGQVWWRSAIRARLETAQASTQPITWLHGVSGAVALGLMLAIVGVTWPSIDAGAELARSFVISVAPRADVADVVVGALGQSLIVAAVAGACLILAPLALYFALSDD